LIEEEEMIQHKREIAGFLLVAIVLSIWCLPHVYAKDNESNTSQRFALNFNEAMNRCLQTGCTNIEEVIGFFANDCSYLDDFGQLWNGKASIRKQFLRTQTTAGTSDRIEGVDVAGSVVTLRLERRRVFKAGKYDAAEVKPHVQVILLKDGQIVRLISVISPDDRKKE
jgi:hypothetical protein